MHKNCQEQLIMNDTVNICDCTVNPLATRWLIQWNSCKWSPVLLRNNVSTPLIPRASVMMLASSLENPTVCFLMISCDKLVLDKQETSDSHNDLEVAELTDIKSKKLTTSYSFCTSHQLKRLVTAPAKHLLFSIIRENFVPLVIICATRSLSVWLAMCSDMSEVSISNCYSI